MRVLITGATGMVGKSVLLEALEEEKITEIVLLSRSSVEMSHSKIKEIIHADFLNLDSAVEQLPEIDACFHCMGVSSIGMSEEEFSTYTFDITKELVDRIYAKYPNAIFNYVSGTATDSTEKGKTMWARVKGKTENYILNKGFKDAYMFRPGIILPEKGIHSRTSWYNIAYIIFYPLFPLFKLSKNVTTTTQFGKAMIRTLTQSKELKHLENLQINELASLT